MNLPPRNFGRRTRDKGLRSLLHRKFVATFLCIAWEQKDCDDYHPIQVCHARDIAPHGHGSGGKPDEIFLFPACRKHHAASEKRERTWGAENGIDVEAICLELALKSPDPAIKAAAKAYLATPKAAE